jgi:hypothetical protein
MLLSALDDAAERAAPLRCIDLQDCVRLSEDALVALAGRLGRRSGAVTSLCLGGCPGVTDRVLQTLCAQMPFVEHLEVSHCRNVTPAGLACVARLTDTLSTLTLRRLVAVTDGAIVSMLQSSGPTSFGQTSFSRLVALDLSECAFLTTKGLGALLSRTPRLRTLRVAMCDGLNERLARALLRLPAPSRLSVLDVSHCGRVLADRPLAAVLSVATGLERLELRGSRRVTAVVDPVLSRVPSVVGRCPQSIPRPSPVLQIVSVDPN